MHNQLPWIKFSPHKEIRESSGHRSKLRRAAVPATSGSSSQTSGRLITTWVRMRVLMQRGNIDYRPDYPKIRGAQTARGKDQPNRQATEVSCQQQKPGSDPFSRPNERPLHAISPCIISSRLGSHNGAWLGLLLMGNSSDYPQSYPLPVNNMSSFMLSIVAHPLALSLSNKNLLIEFYDSGWHMSGENPIPEAIC